MEMSYPEPRFYNKQPGSEWNRTFPVLSGNWPTGEPFEAEFRIFLAGL